MCRVLAPSALALFIGSLVSSCASGPGVAPQVRANEMALEARPPGGPLIGVRLARSVAVGRVVVARDANLGQDFSLGVVYEEDPKLDVHTEVAPGELQNALIDSLKRVGMLSPSPPDASFELTATFVATQGFQGTLTPIIVYRLMDRETGVFVFHKPVVTTAPYDLDFFGFKEALRDSLELAVRANIGKFIEELSRAPGLQDDPWPSPSPADID